MDSDKGQLVFTLRPEGRSCIQISRCCSGEDGVPTGKTPPKNTSILEGSGRRCDQSEMGLIGGRAALHAMTQSIRPLFMMQSVRASEAFLIMNALRDATLGCRSKRLQRLPTEMVVQMRGHAERRRDGELIGSLLAGICDPGLMESSRRTISSSAILLILLRWYGMTCAR